jgi:hypothetical protein
MGNDGTNTDESSMRVFQIDVTTKDLIRLGETVVSITKDDGHIHIFRDDKVQVRGIDFEETEATLKEICKGGRYADEALSVLQISVAETHEFMIQRLARAALAEARVQVPLGEPVKVILGETEETKE